MGLRGVVVIAAAAPAAAAMPKAVCDILASKATEEMVVDRACSHLVDAHLLADCGEALSDIWRLVGGEECPGDAPAPPVWPEVCKVVMDKDFEATTVTKVCSLQHEVKDWECNMALTKTWDEIVSKECSSTDERPGSIVQDTMAVLGGPSVQAPTVQEMELFISARKKSPAKVPVKELVCDFVKNPAMEKDVLGEVCSRQHFVPAEKCEDGLSKICDLIESTECSSGIVGANRLQAGFPNDILPEICELAKNKEIEKMAVSKLCQLQHKVDASECEFALSKVWEEVEEKECGGLVELLSHTVLV
jgi:hypothetical protein